MQLNAPSSFLGECRTGGRARGSSPVPWAGRFGKKQGSIDPYPPRPRTWMGRWLWGLDFQPPRWAKTCERDWNAAHFGTCFVSVGVSRVRGVPVDCGHCRLTSGGPAQL